MAASISWASGNVQPRFSVFGGTSKQRDQVATAFLGAYNLLPPIMRIRLEGRVKFPAYQIQLVDLDAHVAGEANSKGVITINSRILDRDDLVTRTIVHELSHVYDFLKVIPQDIKDAKWDCQMSEQHNREYGVPDVCQLYKNTKTTVSTMPDFLDATGWYQELNGNGMRMDETTFGYRSPDPYEARSPQEMFAVNMEYFLTDREYQCRRPSIYRYLAKHFNFQPFGEQACQETLSFVDSQFGKAEKAIRSIDPSRVYQIHYLLAGDGDALMSSFGHSLARIVVCAPERKTVGPECLQDIQSHIVVSFRAFLDSPQISGWGGLTGQYPSRLFFVPFVQIISEYNVTQLRDLKSYPLSLTREEIKSFLERAVETHWSYNNRYYFLSNNCAVEIMNLLKAGLGRADLMNVRTQTPKGVLQELKNHNLISNEVDMKNLPAAKAAGYYFPSNQANLDQALSIIRELSGQKYSLKKWLNFEPSQRRQLYLSRSFAEPLQKRKWSAAFLYLERFIEKRVTEYTYNQFLQGDIDEKTAAGQQKKSFVDSILKTLSFDQELTGPAQIVKAGYGIPSQQELNDVQGYLYQIQQKREQNQSQIDALVQQLIKMFGANEITDTKANIALFASGVKL